MAHRWHEQRNNRPGATRLWVSDPTDPVGTEPSVVLANGLTRTHPFIATGGKLYFAATDPAYGMELRVLEAPFARLGPDRVLRISGDARGADVRLERAGPDVLVSLAGQSLSFDASEVDSIVVNGTGNGTRLDVRSGTHVFATDAGASGGNLTIDVAAGASVIFNASQNLAALNVSGGGVAAMPLHGGRVLRTRSLLIGETSRLELNDNDLIVDYAPGGPSPEFALRDLVLRARDVGDYGIFFAPGGGDRILAVGEASELGITEFDGVPVDDTTVVGKYTYYGDANFDGQVTTDDYVAVDLGLGTGDSWVQGDFDLNGLVTTDDYVVVDLNLGKGATSPPAGDEAFADANVGVIDVPTVGKAKQAKPLKRHRS